MPGSRLRAAGRPVRPTREGGQALALFAISILAIIAMAALLVDGGMAWSNRRSAQSAADTSVIAAAKAISDGSDLTAATNAAQAVASVNGFSSSYSDCDNAAKTDGVVVNRPPQQSTTHNADNDYVEVIVNRPMQTSFAAAVGQSCWMVSAHAVAQTEPATPGGPAILALDTGCNNSTLHWNAHQVTVIGNVVSNGQIDMNDPDGVVTNGQMIYKQGCIPVPDVPGQYDAQSTTVFTPDPFKYTIADFTCTVSAQDITIKTATIDGVFCAERTITIDNENMTGTATFIAPKITCAKAADIRPKQNNVLMWSNLVQGDGINWKCEQMLWGGIIYAPTSDIHITAKENSVVQGNIWALRVELGGQGWTIEGASSGTPNEGVVKLVE